MVPLNKDQNTFLVFGGKECLASHEIRFDLKHSEFSKQVKLIQSTPNFLFEEAWFLSNERTFPIFEIPFP